ncbi:MAG TPA: glycogen/starch synthase [Polyangiaceae bacterium]|jgi:starch synthase
MDILLATAELAPYTNDTSGAEIASALSKALRQLGHKVTVVAPRQPGFEESGLLAARRLTPLQLQGGSEFHVLDSQLPSGAELVLLDLPGLFDRPRVYGEESADYPDNGKRFSVFARAVAALCAQRLEQGKPTEVVHALGAAAALVPLALREQSVPTVFTLCDLTEHAVLPASARAELGFGDLASLELGGELNVLASALSLAGALTCPSLQLARELSEASSRLAALREGRNPPVAIPSGVDYAVCNPATDTALESRFDAEDTANKGRCKVAALRKFELELEAERPLIVACFEGDADRDRLLEALPEILKNDVGLIVVGLGATIPAERASALRSDFAGDLAVVSAPDDATLRRLYAAADLAFFGDGSEQRQLFALRYGAVPIAFARGGSSDAIVDCDSELSTGTGFLFDELTAAASAGGLTRALTAYGSPSFGKLRRRAMRQDVSWDRPARRYAQVYRKLVHGA